MKTEKIQSTLINPKTTGYAGLASAGLAVLSASVKNKTVRKMHKPLGWTAAFLMLLHTGLIEYYHFKYKKH